ncbi:MAG: hypothetical protein ACYC61_27025 [Isosphaeraceae bacterium]
MTSTTKRGHALLIAAIAAAVFTTGLGGGQARAQWGWGGGFGMGFYGGNLVPYVQQPGNFLNQVALSQMNHVRGPIQNNAYAGNPNAYFNRARDNGFVDRYYPDRGDPSYYGAAAPRPRRVQATPTAATARPKVALTSFFNAKGQLIWPGDAPLTGDLKEKRDAFDKACQTALDELKKNGVASIASVTEARQKLLDYGRPALALIKQKDTARVADGFHVFLLSLYDSLAQAANITPS